MIKFLIPYGRGKTVTEALNNTVDEVNDRINEGYVVSGSMLQTTEKRPNDSFTMFVFVQPMVFRG